ncbi:MAG TPA: zinc-ribbon domain-containing protein [Myxococcota bacterium]|nr:zinc-ribbon domain-containing protein [Myxococcota bacterium]
MIVTCEECSTSFQLDEARIPTSGARVRCSRCKHAFFLPHPSAGESRALHDIAEQAAADAAPGVPRAATDLASSAASAGAGAAAPAAGLATAAEPEEEDWQFSEEVRVEGDDLDDELEQAIADAPDAVAEAAEESAFGVVDDFEKDFGRGAAAPSAGPTEAATDGSEIDRLAAADAGVESGLSLESDASPEPARDESSFGTVDDFSSLIDEDLGTEGGEAAAAKRATSATLDVRAAATDSATTDDLGDPESWDLLGGQEDPGPRPSLFGPGPGRPAPVAAKPSLAESMRAEDPSPIVYDDVDARPSMLRRGVSVVGALVGWSVTLTAIGIVLWFGLRPEWTRWAQSPQSVTSGRFEAETGAAVWVETSRSGPLLLVEGRVRNGGSTPLRPGPVQLALLDARGQRLTAQPLAAGQVLPERTLRESTPEALETERLAAIARFAARPLAPGEARSFQAFLPASSLPDAARRILLEVGEPVAAQLPAAPEPGPRP